MKTLANAFRLALLLVIAYICSSGRIEASNEAAYHRMFAGSSPTSLNLIIAHPDDEVMFFAPTLLQLDARLTGSVTVRVISLTNGGADGLGEVRTHELQDAVQLLMRRNQPLVTVLGYPDGMDQVWDVEETSRAVKALMVDESPIILTFDDQGISNHINHISCFKAVQRLKASLPHSRCYRLVSKSSVLQKYTSFVPALLHVFKPNEHLVFVSSFPQYLLSFASMLNAHVSQMVWFRYGWWFFSYYVFANEIQEFS
ncbi:LANO_0F14290g1_1 [Lachancea nothofagi CBS 11611]|uniref:N-acetylglucosaminylphosphatidylinositol deacetylase n=1 Tax=Lachancea nothofagi CBS 11611 TaxID=1266666 RepID=A0A1G4KC69_9SACH|nr:LANO_0F14290g1_1 [Lachancea nothofagi CBS 11611]